MPIFKLLIDGNLVESTDVMQVINPANETVVGVCPRSTPEQLERAVQAAKRAFVTWSTTQLPERADVLFKLANRYDEHKEKIAKLLTSEQGKPIANARDEVAFATLFLRYFAKLKFDPEVVQDDETQRIEVHRKPLGVVAAIPPWNFPFLQATYKVAPALLTGNTVVLKPAPTTPLTSLFLGELIKDLVPAGVVNVVTDGGDIGPLLTAHPDVAYVSFTGSTAVGKAVMANAASTLKRLTLELGGNDAAIVLDDVDVKEVAPKLFGLAFYIAGQVCISIKRIYVHESMYDAMCDELARLANAAKIGDGSDPATEIGPLQNKQQFDRVKGYIEMAKRYGKIIAGGEAYGPGYFVRPTIVRDITEGNPLIDEETFGPVRSVLKYKTVDEAVARANDTTYGLGGSVWSKDEAKAIAIAHRLDCGTAWVNQHLGFGPHIPFGGVKQSGIGVEFTIEGVKEYTSVHVVSIAKL